MKEEIKNRILQKIANTLVMYAYHIASNGLVNGKMGVMFFLYNYSDYAKDEYYNDFAGDMLDGMLKTSRLLPPEFEDGLSGVGWGVSWLMRHNFIEGDINKVLRPIDDRILTQTKYGEVSMVTGMMNYWSERFRDNTCNYDLHQYIPDLLVFIDRCLKRGRENFTLYHINAILNFLNQIKRDWDAEVCEAIRSLIPVLNEIFAKLAFDNADLYIFRQLLENWGNDIILSPDAEITFCLYGAMPLSVCQQIKVAWLQRVYFDKVTIPLLGDGDIQSFVDETLQNVQTDKFVVNQGLAGLGLFLLGK